MEIFFSGNTVKLDKELNLLDEFVIKFCEKLKRANVKYAIVSGYVAIVFGRSRATEDVDIIFEKMPFEKFTVLWKDILQDFHCINAADEKDAYYNYLEANTSIRFAEPGKAIPNFEFKFVKNKLDHYSIENALQLILNGKQLNIAPLELQIAYKLFLGSEKDEDDAVFLFETFKEKLDKSKLSNFIVLLRIPKQKVDLLENNRPTN